MQDGRIHTRQDQHQADAMERAVAKRDRKSSLELLIGSICVELKE
jgi:hypothetical protein